MDYFLTFRCYGTWLHGDERGSVDRDNNAFATPLVEVNAGLQNYRRALMKAERTSFDLAARQCVFATIDEAAAFRRWFVHALNVQSNHLHLVITPPATVTPEKVVEVLKARATRILREQGYFEPEQPIWSIHGSTRYLYDEASLNAACHYVIEEQGDEPEIVGQLPTRTVERRFPA